MRSFHFWRTDLVSVVLHPQQAWQALPGQFVSLGLQTETGLLQRPYSWFPDAETGLPSFLIRRLPNGEFSSAFFRQLAIGLVLHVSEAKGSFTLPATPPAQAWMLAAGTGIAPIVSLLSAWKKQGTLYSVTLLYAFRKAEEAPFLDLLSDWAREIPQLSLLTFDSAAEPPQHLNNSRLIALVQGQEASLPAAQSAAWICGPFEWMRTMHISLRFAGIPESDIHQEEFHTRLPAFPLNSRERQVAVEGFSQTLTVAPNQTLLTAALAQGLTWPYSCRGGKCGTCQAQLLSGQVHHLVNECLSPQDLQAGKILTCTAVPDSDDIRLKLLA